MSDRKKFTPRWLKKTKFRPFKKKVFGFDIETADNNKTVYCIAIYSEDYKRIYTSKEEFLADLKTSMFRNSTIVGSNLAFDLFGVLWNTDEIKKFKIMMRGETSDLMEAKTYIYKGKLYNKKPIINGTSRGHSITFIDTYNYIKESVEKMGDMLNIPKLKKPECVSNCELPKNKRELYQVKKYNMRDAEISYKFYMTLMKAFESMGASPKRTIAATAMSKWTNDLPDNIKYWRDDKKYLLKIFEGYKGGRTEAFSRGNIRTFLKDNQVDELNVNDVNSMYPDIMLNFDFPDPNTRRYNKKDTLEFIKKYHGMALVTIKAPPDMNVPLLGLRTKDKLLFPLGVFKSWQTHVELRLALELGYKILKVHECIYYLKTCRPFEKYVTELWNKRKAYEQKGNKIMAMVCKLLLNSLYGKFGQKFMGKSNLQPMPNDIDELKKLGKFEVIGNDGNKFIRIGNIDTEPAIFCIPIWAAYVTGHGRIKLFNILNTYKPIYTDTDSIITARTIKTSNKLGGLKLEYKIKAGYVVRAKFYAIDGLNMKTMRLKPKIKIKGIGIRVNYDKFEDIVHNKTSVVYTKMVKCKEALRRNKHINEVIGIEKRLSLEDEKRVWSDKFDPNGWQESKPITIIQLETLKEIQEREKIEKENRIKKQKTEGFLHI